jgi:hypothetical protein
MKKHIPPHAKPPAHRTGVTTKVAKPPKPKMTK